MKSADLNVAHKFEGTILFGAEGKAVRVVGVLSSQTLPETPANLRLVEADDDFVEIAWDDATDALSWEILRGGLSYATAATPTYRDEDVDPDTDYEYQIISHNSAGASTVTGVLTVTTAGQSVPAVPTGLQRDQITAAFVSILWDAQLDAFEWDVFRNNVYLSTVSVPFYVDATIALSSAYSYQVLARNSTGDSALCVAVVVNTPINQPPVWALTDQALTTSVPYSLDLDTVCSDADGHTPVYSTLTPLPPGIARNGRQLAGTPTTPGTTSVTLRANDGYVNADVTINFVVADSDVTGPTAPVISGNAAGTSVTLNLVTPSTDASGTLNYDIYRAGSGLVYSLRETVLAAAFPWSESSVPLGERNYRVQARDASANANLSTFSNVVQLTIVNPSPAPDAPINFGFVAGSATVANGSWSPSLSGATPTSYELDRAPDVAGSPGTYANIFTGLATSYNDTGRTPEVKYHWRVRALNGAIPGPYVIFSLTMPAVAGPPATWVIPTGNSKITFNGNNTTHPGVAGPSRQTAAGDIIDFAAGVHGEREIININRGTQANPILMRNTSTGQAIFQRPSVHAGFANTFSSADGWVEWRGNVAGVAVPLHPKYGTPMGFAWKFAANASDSNKQDHTSYLKWQGAPQNIVMSHFEMDGGWNDDPDFSFETENGVIGIQTNDSGISRVGSGGRFQSGIEFSHFHLKNLGGEGIYLGNNYTNGSLPLRNIRVHHFTAEDIGADVINGKGWWEGDNQIYEWTIKRCCKSILPAGSSDGISMLSSTVRIWNGWAEDCGAASGEAQLAHGVKCFTSNGPPANSPPTAGYPTYAVFDFEIWNVVSIRNHGSGVSAGCQSGMTKVRLKGYNLTCVDNGDAGVNASANTATGGFVRNSVLRGNTGGETNLSGGTTESGNLKTGAVASLFVDYANDDFRLAAAHLVAGGSVLGTDVASADILGNVRTLATADVGAYERAP